MPCKRCHADPHPEGYGNPRRCAFTDDGEFTPNNWNCATIGALLDGPLHLDDEGADETLDMFHVPAEWASTNGWIILTRYKRRGCTSSAMHVGNFWPARPLTLAIAEHVLDSDERNRQPRR